MKTFIDDVVFACKIFVPTFVGIIVFLLIEWQLILWYKS